MTDEQVKTFWVLFEEILKEKGEPFKIYYRDENDKIKHCAGVDFGCRGFVNAKLNILQEEELLVASLNYYNDRGTRGIFEYYSSTETCQIRNDINSITSPRQILFEVDEHNYESASIYFPLKRCNKEDYKKVIEESLPTILEFRKVVGKYAIYIL